MLRNPLIIHLFLTITFLLINNPFEELFATSKQDEVKSKILSFHDLEKITIGPDDNFQGQLLPDETKIVFTRLTTQAPRLFVHDLATDKVKPLLSEQGDGKDPAVSPDGGKVAFTYYKRNSRGDICYKEINADEINCIESAQTSDSEAFWINNATIGFVSKNFVNNDNAIKTYDLESGNTSTLFTGAAWAPSTTGDGRYLIYSGIDNKTRNRVLFIKELAVSNGKSRRVTFDLPGISSFPKVSQDGKYLYFSQFLNDSNHDSIIDGKDNGVVFRIEMAKVIKGGTLFPEQLTSVESNCSYPFPINNKLLVTCAYEGSLDVYQLPNSGIVPANWSEKLLLNAHQVSRSYEDRIIVLNVLQARFPKYQELATYEKLLSNHLMLNESEASRFLIDKILANSKDTSVSAIYKMTDIWVKAEREQQLLPGGRLSLGFQRSITKHRNQLAAFKGLKSLQNMIEANLDLLVNNPSQAAKRLQGFSHKDSKVKITAFFATMAARKLQDSKYMNVKQRVFEEAILSPIATDETRVYYMLQLLDLTQDSQPNLAQRSTAVTKLLQKFSQYEGLKMLLDAELWTLKILAEKDPKGKRAHYLELVKVMNSAKGNFFAIKAIYVRSILNLSKGSTDDFTRLSQVAGFWLSNTDKESIEFSYAREQFLFTALTKAYQSYGKEDLNFMYGGVQAAVTSTDDLEAHYFFIDIMNQLNKQDFLAQYYGEMKKNQVFDQSIRYYEALYPLMNNKGSYADKINEAIDILDNIDLEVVNPAMKFLLLGYCQMEKLRLETEGYEFDQKLAEQAHRSLMLAYDLGKENSRIKASALDNLSLLHFWTRNYSLSARFLKQRTKVGFVDEKTEGLHYWILSKALYNSRSYKDAAIAAEKGMKLFKSGDVKTAFQEKMAYYTLMDGDYKKAVELYESFGSQVKGLNTGKVMLSKGYAYLKAGQLPKAEKTLLAANKIFAKQSPIPQDKDRLVAYQPLRQRFITYGLLAESTNDVGKKIAYRQKRLQILERIQGSEKDYYLKGDDVTRFILKDHLNIAILANRAGKNQVAGTSFSKAIQVANQLAESSGNYSDTGVIKLFENYYAFALTKNSKIFTSKHHQAIDELYQGYVASFKDIKPAQKLLFLQKAKISSMRLAYLYKVGIDKTDPTSKIASNLKQEDYQGLDEAFEMQWKQLVHFSKNLQL